MKQSAKFLMAAAAATMVAAPVAAAPVNKAAPLSITKSARAGAPATKANKLGEGSGFLIAIAVGAAIIAAIVVVGSEGEETPSSP